MHFTMSHTTSLLCVSYLDHLSQIVTNIREIILQTTRVFFRRAWWKEVERFLGSPYKKKVALGPRMGHSWNQLGEKWC